MRIGVDIGGTHILALQLDNDEVRKTSHRTIEGHRREDKTYVIDQIVNCIMEIFPEEALMLEGIGFAVPGNVNPRLGVTRYLPNFGWTEEVNLAHLVLEKLPAEYRNTKVEMRNDGRCAALAEYKFGVGKGCDWPVFSMITLGTGIGGALVIGGKLFDGCSFDAGDFGHHTIENVHGFKCVCGKRGCFETQASAAGLVRHYNSVYRTEKSLDDARIIVDAARGLPDEIIDKDNFFTRWRADLAHGLANIITFYNPNCIAIGGGLSKIPEIYNGLKPEGGAAPRLEELVDTFTLPATRGKCMIVGSSLGDTAGALGAALLVTPNNHGNSDGSDSSEEIKKKKKRKRT